MNYKDYIFQVKKKKPLIKHIWKWTKIGLYIFLIVSMLWGCGQLFVSKYGVWEVKDISGQGVYKPGVFFEIVIASLFSGKEHYFHFASDSKVHEYSYLAISTWSEAFTKTQSPFYGVFVYPIAWILAKIIQGFGGAKNGVAVIAGIFLTSLIVRMITLLFSFKSQMNQEKMQMLQMKQSEIQAKYKGSKDQMSKQKQQMETMALYRKEGMSPFSAIGVQFLSIPFLVAMYTVIKSLRELKSAIVGQISLINQPWGEITSGHPIYLSLLFTYLPLQVLSMFLPTLLTIRKKKAITQSQKKARKKQLIIQGCMSAVFFIFAISIASGVAVYWIFSSAIQITQTLIFHWIRTKKVNKSKFIVKTKEILFGKFHKELTYQDELKSIKNNQNFLAHNKNKKLIESFGSKKNIAPPEKIKKTVKKSKITKFREELANKIFSIEKPNPKKPTTDNKQKSNFIKSMKTKQYKPNKKIVNTKSNMKTNTKKPWTTHKSNNKGRSKK